MHSTGSWRKEPFLFNILFGSSAYPQLRDWICFLTKNQTNSEGYYCSMLEMRSLIAIGMWSFNWSIIRMWLKRFFSQNTFSPYSLWPWNFGRGCQGWWWSHYPWGCSRSNCTWQLVPWSDSQVDIQSKAGLSDLGGLFQSKWFCECLKFYFLWWSALKS